VPRCFFVCRDLLFFIILHLFTDKIYSLYLIISYMLTCLLFCSYLLSIIKYTWFYLPLITMDTFNYSPSPQPIEVHSHKQSKWYNINRFPIKIPLQHHYSLKKQKIKNEQNNNNNLHTFSKSFNLL
jgi:hypothetical protein